mgnify:CR=1 FL=1
MSEPQMTARALAHRAARARPRGRLARLLHEGLNNRLLRNILTVAGGTAGAQALTMAFMPLITRLYGPEAYGVLGMFMGLVMMLVPVAALTYPIAIVLPKRDADARGLVRLSLAVAVLIALLGAALLAGFGTPLVERMGIEEIATYLMLLPLVMLAGAALEITQQWLIRTQRFSLTARVAVLHSLLHNGLRTLGGLVHAVPTMLVLTSALGPALHALLLLIGILRAPAPDPERRMAAGPATASGLALARRHQDFPLFRAPQMLINTISQNSYDPGEDLIDYASTKAAIQNLTRGLAKQLAKKGIRVNAVSPGPIWTPLQVAGGQLPGKMHEFGQDTSLGRAGQPAELATLDAAEIASLLTVSRAL